MKIAGYTDNAYVHNKLRTRDADTHKGQCGRVFVAAGSYLMAGAEIFALKAALRTGSGLVYGFTAPENVPVIQTAVPEAVCKLWEGDNTKVSGFDAYCVGPGLGVCDRTEEILYRVLKETRETVLIDADGLNQVAASSQLRECVRDREYPVIITPHMGEARRLLDNLELGGMSKLEIGMRLYNKYGCITVVKGSESLVAVSDEEAFVNTTGNPGMATAGSGDVLSGVITSLAGQGYSAAEAARMGVYIHGLAGDAARDKFGEYSLIASDIIDCLPEAFARLGR